MKLCKYIHNITDIKYIRVLILNELAQKRIEFYEDIHGHHNLYFLLSVDPMRDFDIYTPLKVKTIHILFMYPYFVLTNIQSHPQIWYETTAKINTLKNIHLQFN